MKCGFWNVRGWDNLNSITDNYFIREKCVNLKSPDSLGIAETHLQENNVLKLDKYQWYGHNRTNIHTRVKRSSGGVGFFIKDELCAQYDVIRLDDSFEGILWLKLVPSNGNQDILCCVCYLLPVESTRNIECIDFLDTLACQIHI